MIISLADVLALIEPHLPEALVAEEALRGIRAIAGGLPPTPMSGFETRLSGSDSEVAFLTCVVRSSEATKIFAGCDRSVKLPIELTTRQAWNRIGQFCTAWLDSDSPLHEGISNLWLEFDLNKGDLGASTVPAVFFGIGRGDSQPRVSVGLGLEILAGRPLRASVERRLRSCLDALSDSAHVFQVGLMLSRESDAVRICVNDIPATRVPGYLADVGWPGQPGELFDLLYPLSEGVECLALDLDVDDSILPRIGLEFYPTADRSPRAEARWISFLDQLVQRGMCCKAKRDALLAWPGCSYERFIGRAVVVRGLNHVKLAYYPGGPVELKAYFGFLTARGGQ